MDDSAVISTETKSRLLLPSTQDISINATGNLKIGKDMQNKFADTSALIIDINVVNFKEKLEVHF